MKPEGLSTETMMKPLQVRKKKGNLDLLHTVCMHVILLVVIAALFKSGSVPTPRSGLGIFFWVLWLVDERSVVVAIVVSDAALEVSVVTLVSEDPALASLVMHPWTAESSLQTCQPLVPILTFPRLSSPQTMLSSIAHSDTKA